ncbi:DUF6455 family protein [Nitratireductor luteus]|uniref:DUF6455 family protein n=1 Tax=Nitratireductor luteus TaxID=2976980 RepID=UPI00223EF9B8|nr:DUF6455 family protein [Nitratireductor luteus]
MGKLADHMETKARNMNDMFERCGVDLAALAADRLGLTLAAAIRGCMFCKAGEECRLWLDIHDGIARIDPPEFCPNAGRIRQTRP